MSKRLLPLLLLALMALPLQAQFTTIGVEAGGGFSLDDDPGFYHIHPIPTGHIQGYTVMNIGPSYALQQFYLRFGLEALVKGCRFDMAFPYFESAREGHYELGVLQIPIMLGWSYNLPLSNNHHTISIAAGANLGCALFGHLYEKQSSTKYDSPLVNFEREWRGSEFFKHQRRLDAGLIVDLSYQWKRWTISLRWQRDLIPARKTEDDLVYVDVIPEEAPKGYHATHQTLLLSIGYKFPLPKKTFTLKNPFEK